MARFAIFFALFAFAAVSATHIKFDGTDDDKTVLTSFGDGSCTVSVLYKGPDTNIEVSPSRLFSVGSITSTEAARGYTNYTIPLNFNGQVGTDEYTVSVGYVSTTGKVTAAGFVIMEHGKVVSGDNGEGVKVGQRGTSTYEVKAVGVDGREVDLSGTKITAKEMSGPYYKEVDTEKTTISSSKCTLALNDYRVGTGRFMIMFEAEAIEYAGETFETVLNVEQARSPTPPCVAMGGDITTTDGYVSVPMYNLGSPPRSSAVEKVIITIDGQSAEWDSGKSSTDGPDQTAVFKISAAGSASITCDGEDAKIVGGDINVSGDDSGPALAVELIADVPTSDSLSTFNCVLRDVASDPSVLSKTQGEALLDQFASVTGASNGVITAIEKGSAVVSISGLVEEDDAADVQKDLEDSFNDCTFQTETGYTDCDDLTLEGITVNAVAAASTASAAGLATWTIVLIACVGAFALILVIVLSLWAVYRRSADQSESDYSSSGPLGVPDPSDLLYEQSIVRDIYGRGDFPDGGPSQEVVEQRAREADMREEHPRPPSSSGLSRGAGTDDASSTYSV